MGFPKAKIIDLKAVRIAVYVPKACARLDKDAPTVLLIHGWPELAYSWKNQLDALVNAGFRAVAMDVRGFGGSSAPMDVADYRIDKIVADVAGVLDGLGVKQAFLCGHDWGGIIVWHAARMIENRVRGVISICTPHMRRPPADPIAIFNHRHGADHYFVAFQEMGIAEHLFAQNPLALFKMLFRTTPTDARPSSEMFYLVKQYRQYLAAGMPELPGPVMCDADMHVYVNAYAKSGFHGGVNLYRNTTANWEYDASLSDTITQASLMVSTANDLFLPPEQTDPMVDMIADLERVTVPDCGHWAMWEKPDEINAHMIDWLGRQTAN